MNVFKWFMRHGAMVLFVAALLIFVISFSKSFFVMGDAMSSMIDQQGLTHSKFLVLWLAVAQSLSDSVWAFLGACLLYRLDHWGRRETVE